MKRFLRLVGFPIHKARNLCLAAVFLLVVRPASAGLIILGDDFTARSEGLVISTANVQLLAAMLVNEWDPDKCGFSDAILNQRAIANYTVEQISAAGIVNVRFLVNFTLIGNLFTGLPAAPGVVPLVSVGGGFDVASTIEATGYTVRNGPFVARQNLVAGTHVDDEKLPQVAQDPVLAAVAGSVERQDPGHDTDPDILQRIEITLTSKVTVTPLNGPPTITVISGGAAINQLGQLTLFGPNPPIVGLNPGVNFLDFTVAAQPSFDFVIVNQPIARVTFETTQHLRLRTDCINCVEAPEPGLLSVLAIGAVGILVRARTRRT